MALSPPSGRPRAPLLPALLAGSALGAALAPLSIPPLRVAQAEIAEPELLAPTVPLTVDA
jgi:hypothetical protein